MAIFGNDGEGVGASPLGLWLPRVGNVVRTVSSRRCTLCIDNRFKNAQCLQPEHLCMQGVTPGAVIGLLGEALRQG